MVELKKHVLTLGFGLRLVLEKEIYYRFVWFVENFEGEREGKKIKRIFFFFDRRGKFKIKEKEGKVKIVLKVNKIFLFTTSNS